MKLFHSIKITVFLYPEEIEKDNEIKEKIKETFKNSMHALVMIKQVEKFK